MSTTISRIENNEIETTIDNAIKIAEAFNIELFDLIGMDLRQQENIMQKATFEREGMKITIEKGEKITNDDLDEAMAFILEEKKKNKELNKYE